MDLARVVYESPSVTISEITGDGPWRENAVELCLGQDSVVFVRCGIFGKSPNESDAIVDANYILFGGDGERFYPLRTSKEPYACSVFRYAGALPVYEPELNGKCVLSTAQMHLTHARLLKEVRFGRNAAVEDLSPALLKEALASAVSATRPRGEHVHTVRAIKELVNQSLSKPPSLSDVAAQLYLSPFTVSRVFHNETGISLRRYIRRLRLRTAVHLMTTARAPLTSIAVQLGFYDEPHFSKAFSAEFGMPPALALAAIASVSTEPSPPSVAPLIQG